MLIINSFWNLFFPYRNTYKVVATLNPQKILISYSPKRLDKNNLIALSPYRDPYIRACVKELKFHNNRKAAKLLNQLLIKWFETSLIKPEVIIPIPLSRKRYRQRGYNQSSLLALELLKHINKKENLTYSDNILKRKKHTEPQTSLDKQARKLNLKNTFILGKNYTQLKNKNVLILDDVTTTGTTLKEARKEIAKAKPKSITCLAIAN